MKAAKLTEHPSFRLMRQTDVQNVWHMQMPRWLFSDPRYADMSLDAKVVYTFLLNRFQLSRRNGWINDDGEVFVIFPRKALAKELRICEQRVTAAFRKLAEFQLIWEKRCGRGDANQIYLASVTPIDDSSYECAPFCSESYESCGSRTADSAFLDAEEPQDTPPQNLEIPAFRTADSDVPEQQDPGASNTILVNLIQLSQMSVHPYLRRTDRRTMKKSSRAFWMLVSFRISSRRWRVFLRMPSSGFFTRTTCASGRLFCRKAGCGHGCIC